MTPCAERNLKLVIAYNGSRYHGWQRQAAHIDTVQQRIETAASRVLKHPVTVHGCSRTDAGVHAEGQVANIHTPNQAVPTEGMRRAMNSRLPADIAVRSIVDVPPDFHASRAARGKTYRYRIHVGPIRPVQQAGQVWHYWRVLDAEPMRLAGRRLIGTHDFAGFAGSGEQRQTTVRTITRCDVTPDQSELHVTVSGDGFLYNMVRNIVGTLVEIGRGHWQPERIDRILASADRRDAGPTAPPDGLCLMCVHYDELPAGQSERP
jgi:tRNA pseudouridine38-40 synthase